MEFLSNPNLLANDLYLFESFFEGITIFYITEFDEEIVDQTVQHKKKYKLKFPDAIIAATALTYIATLISADGVFSKIFNHKFQLVKA